jgi:GrpB-like predicted nucleotidyltransferase (UPF0157 family)
MARPIRFWTTRKIGSTLALGAGQGYDSPGQTRPSATDKDTDRLNPLRLIGLQQERQGPEDHSLELAAFRRIRAELSSQSSPTRLIGLRGDNMRYLGMEVDDLDAIPEGMVGWEIREKAMRVTVGPAGPEASRESPIVWDWRAALADAPEESIGEWTLSAPLSCPGDLVWQGPMELFAHVPFSPTGSFDDEVHLKPYDASWPEQARQMAHWLGRTVGSEVVRRVEHYGSTSLEGMPAKALIDMLVEVDSFPVGRRALLRLLNDRTWEYWWYIDHMILIKRKTPMGKRTHHLHVAPAGHRIWEGLAFRDYLSSHPKVAEQYAALKRRLARDFGNDRERYTREKGAFVRHWTDKALEERASG